jgi:hypothetical protein
MFQQYSDKLSITILNTAEDCQPEPVEGDVYIGLYGLMHNILNY